MIWQSCARHEGRKQQTRCQARPGLGVGDATLELLTFSGRPTRTRPSTTRTGSGRSHVRIDHIFPDGPASTRPSETRIGRGRCHVRVAQIFATAQPEPGQVRPGLGVGDATFELPTFSQRTSLHQAKCDLDWAWEMPRSDCPRFPDAQPEPGQVRPGLGVGDATFELPTFSRRTSLHQAKCDLHWAWEMPRSDCPQRHGKTHQQAWDSLLGRWGGAPWRAFLTHRGAWAGRQLPPIIG
jgi:hypothetical protein